MSTVVAFVLLAAGSPYAQGSGKRVNIYLGAGIGIPSGNLSGGFNTGFHATGRLGFSITPRLSLLLGADFNDLPIDQPGLLDVLSTVFGGFRTTMFGGGLRLDLTVPEAGIDPFLMGGLGLARVSQPDLIIPGLGTLTYNRRSKLYFEGGGGIGLGRLLIQVKIVYINNGFVNSSDQEVAATYLPVTLVVKI